MTDQFQDATKLTPGQDLDRMVAEKVMGWIEAHHYGISQIAYNNGRYVSASIITVNGERIDFAPSRNIAHAFEVVEKMKSLGNGLDRLFQGSTEPWWCGFFGTFRNECAETAPHAICLAALKAVGK